MNKLLKRFRKKEPQTMCLHCMEGYVIQGKCAKCGCPNIDTPRIPCGLPFGCSLKKGQYQIGRVLGNGGFGITYLAWDTKNQRKVAIKELFPSGLHRDESGATIVVDDKYKQLFQHIRKRFLEEARLIYDLRDEPEIIKVYDCFEGNGTAYYVMEYLEGMDLQRMLKKKNGPFSWEELVSPLQQVMRCLHVLHKHGLIHRDISPDNIFVCADGKTLLIDFGSVRREDAGHFTTILKDSFAPPEQFISNGNQGYWTDTYSLCATLYYLLSGGQLPAKAYDRVARLSNTGIDPLIPIEKYAPSSPRFVLQAIMHGMNLDSSQRFGSVEDMQRAFFPEHTEKDAGRCCVLECVQGQYSGRHFYIPQGQNVPVGRGNDTNVIAYPGDPQKSPGISKNQCVFFFYTDGRLFVRDLNSRYGTYLDRQRLHPNTWQEVKYRQSISFGNERYCFVGISDGGK